MPESTRKWLVLGAGALGLAGALTAVALIAPSRANAAAPTYTPADPSQVIARVPVRDAAELAARRALATRPEVAIAVQLAHADLERYRQLSDPRFLGRAQATLAPWWSDANAPAAVLLPRATIRQSLHDFDGARTDLDRLVALEPANAQAHLTRAVVATVTADYDRARQSCAAIAQLASPLVAATCVAPLTALGGDPAAAYAQLASVLAGSRSGDRGVRAWAATTLAELALMRGERETAARHLRGVLGADPDDVYARNLLADVLLLEQRATEASALLADREAIDSHLVRRAIAERIAHGPDAARLAEAMRERIAAAALRGDRVHLREEAMFALDVESDPAAALELARDNWKVQKELADARLLVRAAVAARDPDAAAPVVAWAKTVRDAELDRWLGQLGGAR